jgi:hypothetical protein
MSELHTVLLAIAVCVGIAAQFLVVVLGPVWLQRRDKKSAEKRAALIESFASAQKLGENND